MLDQMQVLTIIPLFPTLLEYPDFQEGVRDGQHVYQEGLFWEDHEKAWAEEDIMKLAEEELSSEEHRQEQHMAQITGWSPLSYLYRLGFTISYLDQALAAKTQ